MNHHQHLHPESTASDWRLALSATVHCLVGCGLGDLVGMTLGTGLGLSNLGTNLLAIALGVLGGFVLGIIPWLRVGYGMARAARLVLVTEGLSIAVMEGTDILVQSQLHIVKNGHLADPMFWLGMALALGAGFLAAFPVNYWLVRRGVQHAH
jgi:putative flippase GtrA